MAQFDCLRCGTAMRFVGQEKLQLGQASWLLGDWPNLVAGALKVSIMACPPLREAGVFLRRQRGPHRGCRRQRPAPAHLPRVRHPPRFRLSQMSPVRLYLRAAG